MPKTLHILALIGCVGLIGCAGGPGKRSKPANIAVTPETLGTSYDYTKPGDIERQDKPVYILPQVAGGWKKAKVDDASGEWRSGQYVAKVMEPGHWATLEEAELSGKPYIIPGKGNKPIVPTPVANQSPTKTGEYSVTGIEQKLAKLTQLSAGNKQASTTSIGNQAAIPESDLLDMHGAKGPVPKFDIPPTGNQHEEKRAAKPTPTPFSLEITPPKSTPTPEPQKQEKVEQSLPDAPPLEIPIVKAPVAKYDAKTQSVVVGYGAPGSTYKVETPKGQISISYKAGGAVDVSYGGKTQTATIPNQSGSVRIDLN